LREADDDELDDSSRSTKQFACGRLPFAVVVALAPQQRARKARPAS
jgi:hypothetical protein